MLDKILHESKRKLQVLTN